MRKIAYITAHAPFGKGEAFIIEEMIAAINLGADLLIVPRSPEKKIFHHQAKSLIARTLYLPLVNLEMFLLFFKSIITNKKVRILLFDILCNSRTLNILFKNILVFPKALLISQIFLQKNVKHIHAHWGSTTATMALIASEMTSIPWSFTVHRWDIAENNILQIKVERANFIRSISEDGKKELLDIVGDIYKEKIKVIYMGVRIPKSLASKRCISKNDFIIACVANFVPKKGHRYLVEACFHLIQIGITNFKCLLIGDGPLKNQVLSQILKLKIERFFSFLGAISHEYLLNMYKRVEIDLVVLPSIITKNGEKEGIPVSLMEAMANGIPVISTSTGGTPELLEESSGIMVPPASPRELAEAIALIITNKYLRENLCQKGYMQVLRKFDIDKNVSALLNMMYLFSGL